MDPNSFLSSCTSRQGEASRALAEAPAMTLKASESYIIDELLCQMGATGTQRTEKNVLDPQRTYRWIFLHFPKKKKKGEGWGRERQVELFLHLEPKLVQV